MAKTTTPKPFVFADVALMDDQEARKLVALVGEHRACIEYDRQGDRIFLTSTSVPQQLDSMNLKPALTEKVLVWVEANRLKLVPLCPEVKEYLRRNKAWQRLLVKGLYV